MLTFITFLTLVSPHHLIQISFSHCFSPAEHNCDVCDQQLFIGKLNWPWKSGYTGWWALSILSFFGQIIKTSPTSKQPNTSMSGKLGGLCSLPFYILEYKTRPVSFHPLILLLLHRRLSSCCLLTSLKVGLSIVRRIMDVRRHGRGLQSFWDSHHLYGITKHTCASSSNYTASAQKEGRLSFRT